ncbi:MULTISPECIES: hypothetical protein [unclassified Saccharibacter]|uniref:hypothetical protein n=1 Tax=unclassified Saccharibacter TaxID=2648722 RepID=UPI001320602B|nr:MULTISPECIES: hypothetical protein [unclassified Saccharibacter]MXV36908.1 hypothetical protein [Saccharibacter sp. EH611]MXV58602.1 hypothetical protein [Saccharibacter sp. EH70]MXV66108.1 hypothetical protein [Saccharibacter sp. EH60]
MPSSIIEKIEENSGIIHNIILFIYLIVCIILMLLSLSFQEDSSNETLCLSVYFYFIGLFIIIISEVKNSKAIFVYAYISLFSSIIFIKLPNYTTHHLSEISFACTCISFLACFFGYVIKNTDSPSEEDKPWERICDGITILAMGVSLYATMASSFETQKNIIQMQSDMSSLKRQINILENKTRTSPIRTPSVCSPQMAQTGRC